MLFDLQDRPQPSTFTLQRSKTHGHLRSAAAAEVYVAVLMLLSRGGEQFALIMLNKSPNALCRPTRPHYRLIGSVAELV